MINIARNQQGTPVEAKDAPKGELHNCLLCGCELCRVISPKGIPFFRAMPGHKHQFPECASQAANRIVRETYLTSFVDFHGRLLTPVKPTEPPVFPPDIPPEFPPEIPPKPRKEPKESILPYRSLKDLHVNGLLAMDNVPIADGYLSNILINAKLAHLIMDNNDSIGPRVIQARPDALFEKEQKIRFVVCCVRGGSHYRKIFEVNFADREEYLVQATRLFGNTLDRDTGMATVVAKNKDVLVHGDWTAVAQDRCNKICHKHCDGAWKCTGMQISTYVSSRQIYPIKHATNQ